MDNSSHEHEHKIQTKFSHATVQMRNQTGRCPNQQEPKARDVRISHQSKQNDISPLIHANIKATDRYDSQNKSIQSIKANHQIIYSLPLFVTN